MANESKTCADCRYFGVRQPLGGYADPVELRAAKKSDDKYFGECLFNPPSGPTPSTPETRIACRAFQRRELRIAPEQVPASAPDPFLAGPSLSQLRRRAQGLRELLRLEVEYQEGLGANGPGAVVGVLRTAKREAEQIVAGLFAAERREAR